MSIDEILDQVKNIPCQVWPEELAFLSLLAQEVPSGGRIVEIGALYGGSTALLALSNPKAEIITIDRFCYTPVGGIPPSQEILRKNLSDLNIRNVTIIEEDSREVAKDWRSTIDLLWVDGEHTYEGCSADLLGFSPYAKVIAAHDYDLEKFPGVVHAVEDLLFINPQLRLDVVLKTIASLRRDMTADKTDTRREG